MPINETAILITHTQWPSIKKSVAMDHVDIESYWMRQAPTSLTMFDKYLPVFSKRSCFWKIMRLL